MKRVDMIVKAPHFYTMKGGGVGYQAEKAMIVDGGKIIDFVDLNNCEEIYQRKCCICPIMSFYRVLLTGTCIQPAM